MSKIALLFLVLFHTNYSNIDAARILAYFPVPSVSHFKVFSAFTQELAKRGHQVTFITPDGASEDVKPNITVIDIHDLSYNMWREKILPMFHAKVEDQTRIGFQIMNEIFMAQIQCNEVQKVLFAKNVTFDLIIIESVMQTEVALSYLYNVPLIQVSSFGASYDSHNIIGAPDDAIIYHHLFREHLFNLTCWQKVTEYYNHYTVMKNLNHCESILNEMLKENFGPGMPSLTELRNNVQMLFLNINPLWDKRPVPPGVVFMGGMHLKDTKELPKDLKDYLDSSTNGVIYVSFGSNVQFSTLPKEKIQIFLKVFSEIPYNILLKSDMDELEGRSTNVKLSKWFPQADLLGHPNIKLFITQGGLQSIDETIREAVPIIGIPIVREQVLNVEHCVHYGTGIKLDIKLITEESFRAAIDTVITNNSYHLNAIKLRSWMRDQRQTPVERAMWWIEYVLRHGGARHLRAPGANMHWTERLELNLLLSVTLSLLFFIIIFVFGSYYSFKRLLKIFKTIFIRN